MGMTPLINVLLAHLLGSNDKLNGYKIVSLIISLAGLLLIVGTVSYTHLNKVTDNVNLEIQTARTSLAQAIKQVDLTGSSLEKARENEQKALAVSYTHLDVYKRQSKSCQSALPKLLHCPKTAIKSSLS